MNKDFRFPLRATGRPSSRSSSSLAAWKRPAAEAAVAAVTGAAASATSAEGEVATAAGVTNREEAVGVAAAEVSAVTTIAGVMVGVEAVGGAGAVGDAAVEVAATLVEAAEAALPGSEGLLLLRESNRRRDKEVVVGVEGVGGEGEVEEGAGVSSCHSTPGRSSRLRSRRTGGRRRRTTLRRRRSKSRSTVFLTR